MVGAKAPPGTSTLAEFSSFDLYFLCDCTQAISFIHVSIHSEVKHSVQYYFIFTAICK